MQCLLISFSVSFFVYPFDDIGTQTDNFMRYSEKDKRNLHFQSECNKNFHETECKTAEKRNVSTNFDFIWSAGENLVSQQVVCHANPS